MKKYLLLLLIPSIALAENFKLSSPELKEGSTLGLDQVFKGFGCEGNNLSPELSWKNAPKETKSFAINVYDPDAPTGSGWWHWSIFNIPANINTLTKGSSSDPAKLPSSAIQGRTDYGTSQFGGACPPVGDKPHHYIFTVYALDTEKIELDSNSSGALVGYYLNKHAIAKAKITAMYGRK